MAQPHHVRIIGGRPFNWADRPDDWMDEGPYSAVRGDSTPAGWGAVHAAGMCVAVVLFALGLYLTVTAPPGRADVGLIGIVLVLAAGGIGALAWGCYVHEQERGR